MKKINRILQTITPGRTAAADTPASPGMLSGIMRWWQRLADMWQRVVRGDTSVYQQLLTAGELLIIFVWTLVVTFPYLNFDPMVVPAGREFLHHVHPHYVWEWALACGWCATWNGNVRAGYPAFADVQSSLLHPLVILPTLLLGVINGAKITLVGAFFMGGLAQWWLGRVVGAGRIACVWTACIAVAAGHLSARMEHGVLGLVIATAACALVLPPLVSVLQTGSRRSAVLLGITLAMAALAGQGYMQIGLLLTLPAALVLVRWNTSNLLLLVRRFALAGFLATLLAAPFLLPFAYFLPEFTKYSDPSFDSAQPLKYIPLNLVIDDLGFFTSEALGKQPYPAIYVNFVGWVPVLLALWALRGGSETGNGRIRVFLVATVLLAFWMASGIPLMLTRAVLDLYGVGYHLTSVRFPPLFSLLAVPPLLALSAIGLHQIINTRWPMLQFGLTHQEKPGGVFIDLRWLLVIPLLLALHTVFTFSRNWVLVTRIEPGVMRVVEALRTPDLQWVSVPPGEHFWIEPAIRQGLKLTEGVQGWFWYGRPVPLPVRSAVSRNASDIAPPGMEQLTTVDGFIIYEALPGREYATVIYANNARTPCSATGMGGNIDVVCETTQRGELVLQENNWTGWQAYLYSESGGQMNGARLPLHQSPSLGVDLPAGKHVVEFRYRPWDAQLGTLLSLFGLVLAFYIWRKGEPPHRDDQATDHPQHAEDETNRSAGEQDNFDKH